MKFRPLHDRILVRKATAAERSAGGIIIPEKAAEKPQQGEVLAVGPGQVLDDGTLREPGVKVGETVLFGAYGGTEVKIDGEDLLVLKAADVFAVIE
jgi:chaperonin GroES